MGEGMRLARNARVGRSVQPHETLGRDVRDMLDQDHPRNKWLTMRKRSQEATSDRGSRHITSHGKDLLSPVVRREILFKPTLVLTHCSPTSLVVRSARRRPTGIGYARGLAWGDTTTTSTSLASQPESLPCALPGSSIL